MILFLTINLTNPDDRGGLAEYYRRAIPHIHKNHESIFVLNINTGKVQGSVLRQEEYRGVPIYSLPVIDVTNIDCFSVPLKESVNLLIDNLNLTAIIFPDHLFVPYLNFNLLRKNKVKIVFFVHLLYRGMFNAFLGISKPVKFNVDAWVTLSRQEHYGIVNSDYILTNSYFTRNEVLKYYGDSIDCDVIALQLGVNMDEWHYSPQNDTCEIGYYGRLAPQKGVNLIIDQLSNSAYHSDKTVQFAGSGPLISELLKSQQDLSSVNYCGNLNADDIKLFLKPLKWILIPSVYEPWGQVLTECLAMGKICLISSYKSGLTEQISHGVNGFHIDFNNQSFLDFIEEMENNGTDFDLISSNARKSAKNINDHIGGMLNFLERIEESCQFRVFSPWRKRVGKDILHK